MLFSQTYFKILVSSEVYFKPHPNRKPLRVYRKQLKIMDANRPFLEESLADWLKL
jgi:hypothetical protein